MTGLPAEKSIIDSAELGLDPKLLSSFIYELNISRRLVTTYPKDHPIIVTAVGKVLTHLHQLLEFAEEFTLGIAKDFLLLGTAPLEKNNPIYKDFARTLFERGVALLTIHRDLSQDELHAFNLLLARKKDLLEEQGGIFQLVEEAGITHLTLQGVDYNLFKVTEEERIVSGKGESRKRSETIWESFVGGLIMGNLDPQGRLYPSTAMSGIDPEALAEIVNTGTLKNAEGVYGQAVSGFLGQIDQDLLEQKNSDESISNLVRFVQKLNPGTRRQFLATCLQNLNETLEVAELVLNRIPSEIIMESLRDAITGASYAPPMIIRLMHRLVKSAPSGEKGTEAGTRFNRAELTSKFKTIFREDELDSYVPKEYQQSLQTILVVENLSGDELHELDDLRKTLEGHWVESRVGAILLEIVSTAPAGLLEEGIERSLAEICEYYLEMGEFGELARVHETMTSSTGNLNKEQRETVLAVFTKPSFLEEILNGPRIWGKPKFAAVRNLVRQIGAPFVDPLLARLAEEGSLSLRRLYMDLLIALGEVARDAAVARLGDKRWYFVRNLVVILRNLNDLSALRPIRRLVNHQHPKIRSEVIRTMLHFRDPEADRLLLLDLGSDSSETRLSAIQLAGRSRSPEVFRRLLAILSKGGVTGEEFDLKKAAIQALAETGNKEALPELEKILSASHLLHRALYHRLKLEIIRSLDRYPAAVSVTVLAKVVKMSNDELATTAMEVLQRIYGRNR
jgi:hypothetical protein